MHQESSDEPVFRRILIGIDGSPSASDALSLGRHLAARFRAEILLGAALDYSPGGALDQETFDNWLSEDTETLFDPLLPELEGLSFRAFALGGRSPARLLQQLAEDEDGDLIVVGSTHRGSLGQVYPGSVGERLLDGAPCPVAVAPRGYGAEAAAPVRRIGVGYDGAPESRLALEQAQRMALGLGAELTVIAALPPLELLPGRPGPTRTGYKAILRDQLESELEQAAGGLPAELHAKTVLEEGEPASVLCEQAGELDLLVVGSRGYGPVRRTLVGGCSAAVMRSAPCPVVAVPRSAEDERETSRWAIEVPSHLPVER